MSAAASFGAAPRAEAWVVRAGSAGARVGAAQIAAITVIAASIGRRAARVRMCMLPPSGRIEPFPAA
ncbi:MAG: hypothetical protein K2X11_15595 [Acetobacteraceae bacterium]|nr:hypothetical protein [Acetobacteraceae bacterium]